MEVQENEANGMTVEEAKKIIDKMLVKSYKNNLYQNAEKIDNETALEKAMTLLEKQIPKKPLPETRYYGNGKCPLCGAVFIDKMTNYCGNCGQALDWGGDNG